MHAPVSWGNVRRGTLAVPPAGTSSTRTPLGHWAWPGQWWEGRPATAQPGPRSRKRALRSTVMDDSQFPLSASRGTCACVCPVFQPRNLFGIEDLVEDVKRRTGPRALRLFYIITSFTISM